MSIHPTAIVDPSARVHEDAEIGPWAYVGPNSSVGEGTVLMHHAWVGTNVTLGKGNVLHPFSVVGQDPQYLGFDPRTTSGTIIGNGNHFREFSTIHRGLKPGTNTVIGNDCYFMTTSHVAHDCQFGSRIVMVNYSGVAGHVEVGDGAFISGQVGVHQFCRIGTLAMVGGGAGVAKDVPPYLTIKHYGVLIGVNVVGLRRAGFNAETRTAIRQAYIELFRSGRPVTKSLEVVRAEWQGREMPRELAHFLDFCSTKSKRGLSRGPRSKQDQASDEDDSE